MFLRLRSFLLNENHQQCWWFQKALALHSSRRSGGSLVQRELSAKLTEGLYSCKRMIKQSLRHGLPRTPKARKLASGNPVAVPPPFTQGRLKYSCHICGGGATTASGGFFDEPIGSACGMPQGSYRKPPARLVVMTVCFLPFWERYC